MAWNERPLTAKARIRDVSLGSILVLVGLVRAASGQSTPSEQPGSVRGTVLNSATHEPVPRALVFSPDNRFATLSDSQGRFEFEIPQSSVGQQPVENSESQPPSTAAVSQWTRSGPSMLMARKPGFLQDPSGSAINVQGNTAGRDWTITLVPEALIIGKVTRGNSEASDSVQLELYRRLVQDGRARWVFMKGTSSRSDGEFRFADLPEGTYKLLTRESLDRDPLAGDPRGQLFGFPPVYFPTSPGFGSAAEIRVEAGEITQTAITLVRQAYHNIRIPVIDGPGSGLVVTVFVAGSRGPGYSLGYNAGDQAIEGLLPNGSYAVEATSYLPNDKVAYGSVHLTVRDGTVSSPAMALSTGITIPLLVREEFTQKWQGASTWMMNGRQFAISGPRRYLNVTVEPEDDFGGARGSTLRPPSSPNDQSLVVENVIPGRYWVRITTSRGYVAAARSGNTDLLHAPLAIGEGGAPAPIEITLRDETAEIDGTIEGISSFAASTESNAEGFAPYSSAPAHVYCIPLPDSAGVFTEIGVSPDGSFQSPPLAPGAYRVLAFSRPHSDLEYYNPEALRSYDSKGPVVRVSAGQKESVRVQLIAQE